MRKRRQKNKSLLQENKRVLQELKGIAQSYLDLEQAKAWVGAVEGRMMSPIDVGNQILLGTVENFRAFTQQQRGILSSRQTQEDMEDIAFIAFLEERHLPLGELEDADHILQHMDLQVMRRCPLNTLRKLLEVGHTVTTINDEVMSTYIENVRSSTIKALVEHGLIPENAPFMMSNKQRKHLEKTASMVDRLLAEKNWAEENTKDFLSTLFKRPVLSFIDLLSLLRFEEEKSARNSREDLRQHLYENLINPAIHLQYNLVSQTLHAQVEQGALSLKGILFLLDIERQEMRNEAQRRRMQPPHDHDGAHYYDDGAHYYNDRYTPPIQPGSFFHCTKPYPPQGIADQRYSPVYYNGYYANFSPRYGYRSDLTP